MPYSGIRDPKLPSYVVKLSEENKKKWISIFNSSYEEDGEEVAFIVANSWLKRKLKEIQTMARTDKVIERVSFVVEDTEHFISRSEDGEEYISFKLADNVKDKFGVKLPEFVLKKWEDLINSGLPLLGDVDHEEYDRLLQSGLTDDEVKAQLKNKKNSIAKTLKAVYDKGKLWVRAIIDKRYRNVIKKSKGVSLEAALSKDMNGNIVDADLLGFTFGVKDNPVIEGTQVYT